MKDPRHYFVHSNGSICFGTDVDYVECIRAADITAVMVARSLNSAVRQGRKYAYAALRALIGAASE